ncbi:GDSL-type esterase/lipase family protein [Blautia sp. MSJ-19]|uniref:GDSL-type esterase/lipase family protein n=1 Tax=Blautia sp. MSJ-19 TaxID=2841517 RepID=UPI001C0ED02D|nr:GDSL-type esterase/lipase family protein [Blautia sp. MSJ-19]MBU5480254.1 arylesterase [Blautia sp. MSJ-19]
MNILCFGDSNTWGYKPDKSGRFDEKTRWTGLLQKKLGPEYHIIEEGLCGRTTVFQDELREGRRGLDLIGVTVEMHNPIDLVIIMLGTNDCKTRYRASASVIANGLNQVIRKARQNASQHFDLLVISPIHLGAGVGDADFDPEFDPASETVSRNLASEYRKVALQNHAAFLNAADFATPSITDREHMDEKGHAALAEAVYDKIIALQKGLSNVI